ncbi:MAG: alpha/beta hydrolase [archaeon]|nr:alpha/beta hydrolase [archaeon]
MPNEFITFNGIKTYIEYDNLEKNSDKIPFVMIHGWTADRFRNYPIYEYLKKKGIPVICYDLRGHGSSQKGLTGKYTMEVCADDFYAIYREFIVEKFGYDKFNFYGHSMGGFIGLILVNRFPEIFNKLFLISTWVKNYMSKEQDKMFQTLLNKYEEDYEKIFGMKKAEHTQLGLEFFPHWEDPSLFPEKEATVEFGWDMLKNDNIEQALEKINWPTHILVRANDNRPFRKIAEVMRDNIKQTTYNMLESGHNMGIEARNELSTLIMKYLEK